MNKILFGMTCSFLCAVFIGCGNNGSDLVSTAQAQLLSVGGTTGQGGAAGGYQGGTDQGGHAGGPGMGGTAGIPGTGGSAGSGGDTWCWKDTSDQPYPDDERNDAAFQGAEEGWGAAVEQHNCIDAEDEALCQGGVIWPGGLNEFCVYAAAWASAQACAFAEAVACAPGGLTIELKDNACVVTEKPPMCVWATASACAYAQAYAFAWACVGNM